jgi:flagellar basal-body rod modification protein FlgD
VQISATSPETAAAPSGAAAKPANNQVSKEAFLQLLVAQIKNQNPMNPTDGVQLLSQLAQFSQLEQLLGIREDLGSLIENTQPQQTTNGDQP